MLAVPCYYYNFQFIDIGRRLDKESHGIQKQICYMQETARPISNLAASQGNRKRHQMHTDSLTQTMRDLRPI